MIGYVITEGGGGKGRARRLGDLKRASTPSVGPTTSTRVGGGYGALAIQTHADWGQSGGGGRLLHRLGVVRGVRDQPHRSVAIHAALQNGGRVCVGPRRGRHYLLRHLARGMLS